MKKFIPFLVLLLIITNSVLGQNTVEYDFKTKSLDTIKPVRVGENCVFKVKNINKFIYEVKIESSQSKFNSEPPGVFSNIFKLETQEKNNVELEVTKINNQVYRDTKANDVIFFTKYYEEQRDSLLKEIDVLKEGLEKLEPKDSITETEITKIETDKSNIYNSNNDNIIKKNKEEIIKQIQEKRSEIIENENKAKELEKGNKDFHFRRLTQIQSKGKKISNSFDKLEGVKEIKNRLIRISLTDGMSFEIAKSKIDELSKEYNCIDNSEILLSEFNNNYKIFKRTVDVYEYEKMDKEIDESDEVKINNSIERLSTEVDNLYNKVSAYDYNLLFQEINKLCSELKNENNYFVSSDPVQAKADIINYNVIIKPREGNDPIFASEKRDFNIEVPVYEGVKIDFSTGFFVTNNLYNRKYSISNYLADSSMKIISQDKNNSLAQFSLGALLHISKRCNRNFKPALTFGLGLNSTDLTNLQVFLGFSAMLGSSERFIISTGLSLANVDYLKGKYYLGTPTMNLNDDTPLTEKVIIAGWFISFTYNLTSKKKEQ